MCLALLEFDSGPELVHKPLGALTEQYTVHTGAYQGVTASDQRSDRRGVDSKIAKRHADSLTALRDMLDGLDHAGMVDLTRETETRRQIVGSEEYGIEPGHCGNLVDILDGPHMLSLNDD
jgi:hypothetical protein